MIPFWGCIFLVFFWGWWCNLHQFFLLSNGATMHVILVVNMIRVTWFQTDYGWGRDTNLITKRCKSRKTTGWSSFLGNNRWLCVTNCRARKTFLSFPRFPTKMTCFFKGFFENRKKKISFYPKWHILCLKDFWSTSHDFTSAPCQTILAVLSPSTRSPNEAPAYRLRWVNIRRVCEELGYS